ncbi:putative phospholipid:diacylglycerol acyltransferase [Dioszegia hungarica]|uniref:Phospholipid:diacylglycerol acyltransferase n=1 Tax=Dioszegia hungarica TaxID=4972 RepID=A0AA38HF67_9TREE|nr:putative phospholipid:diacylglycerol acyltransferase [Dioszegia hungarica]KAI9639305.1 putative phospholipid:diacylglycerol acyltransferase [Dioszegia hungarica]
MSDADSERSPASSTATSSTTGASPSSTTARLAPPPTTSLRQRFQALREMVPGQSPDVNIKLRKEDDGNFKMIAPGTPFDEIELDESLFVAGSDGSERKSQKKRTKFRKWATGRKFVFPIGIAIGVALCAWVMNSYADLPTDFSEIMSSIPSSLDPRDLFNNLTALDTAKKAFTSRDFLVGEDATKKDGLKKRHPMVLVPGIVSTGLESWSTEPVSRTFFRKRLWGTSTMIRAVVSNKEKWLEAISLDPETGLDPSGYKVRAAQGLDAASEFIQGYWVWQKIVENLAVLGYDTNSMDMAAYDWRLSYYNVEIRDAYFSRLKSKIELLRRTNKQKVVICSHSMGGTMVLYLYANPDVDGFGGGAGPEWVDEHIESWINIAGSILGVAKAMTAFLSGEMRDTVELHPAGSWVLEKFFSRKERAKLFRQWPGASSMWIKGGNRIWGTHNAAPDDPQNATDSHGRFFSFRHAGSSSEEADLDKSTVSPNLTMNEASPYILTHTPTTFQRMVETNYSYGFESDEGQLKKNDHDHRKWTNPLEVRLPTAKNMKIYCLYGHGKETERSYWYMKEEYEHDESRSEAIGEEAICNPSDSSADNNTCVTQRTPLDFPLARKHRIDVDVTVKGSRPEVRSGVKFGDGDGTIPIISLGAMCVRGWKGKTKWNPSGIEVITQEFRHSPQTLDIRGGAQTADHVDILGSTPLNEAIMKIASGRGDLVENQIESRIEEIVEKMQWD